MRYRSIKIVDAFQWNGWCNCQRHPWPVWAVEAYCNKRIVEFKHKVFGKGLRIMNDPDDCSDFCFAFPHNYIILNADNTIYSMRAADFEKEFEYIGDAIDRGK